MIAKKITALALSIIYLVIAFDGVMRVGNYSEIVDGVDGTIFLVHISDTVISNNIRMFGQYERPARDLVLSFVDKGAVVFDIGANIGSWTIPIAIHVGPAGRVYSFEVMFESFSYLVSNIALNGLSNIRPFLASVGKTTIPVSVPVSLFHNIGNERVNMGGFSLQIYETFREDFSPETSQVQSVVLDQLLGDGTITCPALLKMDVELHELQVLQGAKQLLTRCRPVVYLELTCQALSRSILSLLHYLNYVSAWVVKFPVSHSESHHGRTWQSVDPKQLLTVGMRSVNVLAIPKEREGELRDASGQLLDGVFVIDVEGGMFYASQYNIRLCVGEEICDLYQQNPELVVGEGTSNVDTHCSGVPIPIEDREYWKELTNEPS